MKQYISGIPYFPPKPFKGALLEEGRQLELPVQAIDSHPVVIPSTILGYQVVSI